LKFPRTCRARDGREHTYDDKFFFPEDPHTKFDQLADRRAFRKWVYMAVELVLARGQVASVPSCEAVWIAQRWGAVVGGGGKKGRRGQKGARRGSKQICEFWHRFLKKYINP
jgi:hypothetical protein